MSIPCLNKHLGLCPDCLPDELNYKCPGFKKSPFRIYDVLPNSVVIQPDPDELVDLDELHKNLIKKRLGEIYIL